MKKSETYQGIWIDKHKAHVFTFRNEKLKKAVIDSGIETRLRIDGESKSNTRFGEQFIESEKKNENRLNEQMNHFFKEVKNQMLSDEDIVLFGPAEIKNKLAKYSNKKNIVGVKTVDSMTENQMAAWIKDYFKLD